MAASRELVAVALQAQTSRLPQGEGPAGYIFGVSAGFQALRPCHAAHHQATCPHLHVHDLLQLFAGSPFAAFAPGSPFLQMLQILGPTNRRLSVLRLVSTPCPCCRGCWPGQLHHRRLLRRWHSFRGRSSKARKEGGADQDGKRAVSCVMEARGQGVQRRCPHVCVARSCRRGFPLALVSSLRSESYCDSLNQPRGRRSRMHWPWRNVDNMSFVSVRLWQ